MNVKFKRLLFAFILLIAGGGHSVPALANEDPDVLKMVFVPASEKGDESDYISLIKIISDRADVQIERKVVDYNAAVEAMRAGRAIRAWYGQNIY